MTSIMNQNKRKRTKNDNNQVDAVFTKKQKKENYSESIGRCSTPTKDVCFHCDHYHSQDCCLYVYDIDVDKRYYSRFMDELENPVYVKHKQIQGLPEAVSGNFTKIPHPTFTPGEPAIMEFLKSPSPVLFQQFYKPVGCTQDCAPKYANIPPIRGPIIQQQVPINYYPCPPTLQDPIIFAPQPATIPVMNPYAYQPPTPYYANFPIP